MSAADNVWSDYGVPRRVSNKAQMYVLTNEQIGFIASLVTGTNDVFSFQIPMPFYIDQQNQAVIYERIDFIFRFNHLNDPTLSNQNRLQVDLQYSDKEPAANWDGSGEDVEDENIQAMFDGPFLFGQGLRPTSAEIAAAGTTLIGVYPSINSTSVHYYPPDSNGLDAFFPVTVVFTNQTFGRDVADQVADVGTFTAFENVSLRCYFRVRNLTPSEKALMTSEYYGLVPYS